MRWGVCSVLLLACGIPALDGSEKECPCADGFVCDEARNRCVELDAGQDDAGSDARDDASNDASMSDGGDAGDRDGGADAGADDASGDDAGADADLDSGRLDVGIDVGIDVGDPDTGEPMCPYDGLYCTNFEEASPPYARRGGGGFSTRAPGYMSPLAGYYGSAGEAAFTEFDGVSLPARFFVRFWYRIEPGSFTTERAIFGALLPGGSDEGVLIRIQNTSGRITVTAGSTSGGIVSDGYGPPGDGWTCIRLDVRPNGIDLEIDDQGEVSTNITPLGSEFDDVGFGILEAGSDPNAIVFDEIVITDSPVPCAL